MQLTISEAAAHCGYKSRTVLYRLQRGGLLRDYEAGRHGRSLLLESNPPGRCSLREHVMASVQLRCDSPLGQRHRPAAAAPLEQLSDEALAAYCDEHLSDEVMTAAMAPINQWIESQQSPDWQQVAEHLNAYLGPQWPAPPWSGDQVATVAMALSLAEEAAAGG